MQNNSSKFKIDLKKTNLRDFSVEAVVRQLLRSALKETAELANILGSSILTLRGRGSRESFVYFKFQAVILNF